MTPQSELTSLLTTFWYSFFFAPENDKKKTESGYFQLCFFVTNAVLLAYFSMFHAFIIMLQKAVSLFKTTEIHK